MFKKRSHILKQTCSFKWYASMFFNEDFDMTFFMMLCMVWTPIADFLNQIAHDGLQVTGK